MSDTAYPNVVATTNRVRENNRHIVKTPDGIFVVRRVNGLDFVETGVELVREQAVSLEGATPEAREKHAERLAEQSQGRVGGLITTFLTKSVVATTIYELDGVFSVEEIPGATEHQTSRITFDQDDEGAIYAYDLNQETLRILLNEIKLTSSLSVGSGDRLRRFRDGEHNSGGSSGEKVREASKRDVKTPAR